MRHDLAQKTHVMCYLKGWDDVLKILFVCTGNTCRSPMAEAIFNRLSKDRNLNHSSFSRGTMTYSSEPASQYAADAVDTMCGADLSGHISRQISTEDIAGADLILTMTIQHWNIIIQDYPDAAKKIFTIFEYATGRHKNISDPFGRDISVYLDCAQELYKLIEEIIDKLNR